MTWTAKKTIPTHAVPNLDAGIQFYEKLGFSADWRWPKEGPTHAGLNRGVCSIMLCECEPMVTGEVYFLVDNVDACFAEISANKSWELAEEFALLSESKNAAPKRALIAPASPTTQGYGYREFTIVDPWGHQISFGEIVEKDACES